MEDKEKIIKKIESLLALAGNNPSMQEAAAAAYNGLDRAGYIL